MLRNCQKAIAVVALCALLSLVPTGMPGAGVTAALGQSALPNNGSVQAGGWWYGFAAGWGWSRVDCDVCRGDLVGGATGMLKGGITQSRALDLGLEVNGWHQDYEGVNRWHGTFSLMGYYYPGPIRRLVLSGGFGMLGPMLRN